MLKISARISRFSTQWRRILIPFLTLGGLSLIYIGTARSIAIVINGEVRSISTHARTVENALLDAAISVGPFDRVLTPLESSTANIDGIELRVAQLVSVQTPSKQEQVWSPETIPANILGQIGISLLPGDRVWVDGVEADQPGQDSQEVPISITYKPAETVRLQTEGSTSRFQSRASSFEGKLWEHTGRLYEADVIETEQNASGPVEILLFPSRPISIEADGEFIQSRSSASYAGDALLEAGVIMTGLDRSEPAVGEEIGQENIIRVVRVRETVSFEEEPIPFDIIYEAVPDLEIDNQTIVDAGSYGIIAQRLRTRFEDGEEVSLRSEGEWLAVPPVSRTIGYGSQVVVRSTSTGDGAIEYWRAIDMWATSYSPSRAGVSPEAPNFGITASGAPLTKGLVAIDRNLIPFGTQLYVPGYGFATAADTGGGVKGKWIDLGYDDNNWVGWAQYVTVYFLTPVPSPGSIVWIFP